MLSTFLWSVALTVVGVLLGGVNVYAALLGMVGVCIIAIFLLHLYVVKCGVKIFNNLQH